ncbi:MAG: hypothetical protein ACYSSP_13090 [Planctomycetota bacterium]|jgi:hypothetical protein
MRTRTTDNQKFSVSSFLIILIFYFAMSSIVLGSGWNDYAIHLVNGYELVRTNAPSVFIYRPYSADNVVERSCEVPPKIVGINIYGDIVFGKTEYAPDADDRGQTEAGAGFFILDTKNHQVQLGLDKDAWLISLKELGMSKEPSLNKPSRFYTLKIKAYNFAKWFVIFIILLLVLLIMFLFVKRSHKFRGGTTESQR